MTNLKSKYAIIIPCYNEEKRLNTATFLDYAKTHSEIIFLFVNDGSTDNTKILLESLCKKHPEQLKTISLDKNQGKAEAVRNGFMFFLKTQKEIQKENIEFIGFWDADLATPLSEIPRYIDIMATKKNLLLVLGSRIRLLGRAIERNPLRHYLGRFSATAISLSLGIGVYDTQCGAKLFRITEDLAKIFEKPFISKWLFDVEILMRMIVGYNESKKVIPEENFYELPLNNWKDYKGSKVKPSDFLKAFIDLYKMYIKYYVKN